MGIGPYFQAELRVAREHQFSEDAGDYLPAAGIPPLNLFDAVTSDLSDCFTNTPDYKEYRWRGRMAGCSIRRRRGSRWIHGQV
jgi:hypothetical protein